MKLRHALAAAVATAAIAPAALMAAPAAHAEGEIPAAQTTAGDTGGEPTTPAPSAETQPAPAGDETDGTQSSSAGTGSGDTSTTEESDETGESASGESASGDADGTGDNATGDTANGGENSGGEGESDSDCAIDAADLKVRVVGLPSKLVAGAGWSRFTVKLTNTTDHSLDEVYPIIYAAPLEDVDHPRELLRMQYRNPETGKWTRFSEWTEGQYFGMFQLDAHMTADLELRIRATEKAKDGDGIAIVAGDYYNEDGTCGWSEEEWYEFSILAAGADPGDDVPPAEPGKPGDTGTPGDERPGKNVKPQGGMTELPVKGHLAETGSSSTLPLFALSGAAAVALGAGAVYVVRRRKADGTGTAA